MAGNRFFKCEIWTQNKWFRELNPTTKLFWFYLIGTCDNVGVWEEDWELASFVMKISLDTKEIIHSLDSRVQRISPGKLWITDFCDFQYGILNDQRTDAPGLSYIKLLKKHGLWEGVNKPLGNPLVTPKDKDKDKDKDKAPGKDKEQDRDKDGGENSLSQEEQDDYYFGEDDEK